MHDTLAALTVRGLRAHLIREGLKTAELRTWPPPRGLDRLVICSAASASSPGHTVALVRVVHAERADLDDPAWTDARWRAAEAAAGADALLDNGVWVWWLADVVPLVPHPVRGRQRIWQVDARLVVPGRGAPLV
jgi:hypothetical protein